MTIKEDKARKMKKRIDYKESRTAEMTCMCRAMSFHERNQLLKSDDYIAMKIIPPIKGFLLRIFKSVFRKIFFPHGLYAYVIARTKYIDSIFQNIDPDITQIVILGAGFDSRAIRFQEKLQHATIFEIDVPNTQTAKIAQYKKCGITIPPNLKFVAIDFTRETLDQKLKQENYQPDRQCLFLLEGLTMYLDARSIDVTFSTISEFAGKGSLFVFDFIYAGVLRGETKYHGGQEAYKRVMNAGEPWTFGIEEGQIDPFLAKYGLTLRNESNAERLEERFYSKNDGPDKNATIRVNGAHCIVTAIKA